MPKASDYIYDKDMTLNDFADANGLDQHKGWDEDWSEAEEAWCTCRVEYGDSRYS